MSNGNSIAMDAGGWWCKVEQQHCWLQVYMPCVTSSLQAVQALPGVLLDTTADKEVTHWVAQHLEALPAAKCTSESNILLALKGSCSRDNLSKLRRDGSLPRPATGYRGCQASITGRQRPQHQLKRSFFRGTGYLLYDRVRRSSISLAFFVELSMALIRDACSLQLFSSRALFSVCSAASPKTR